MDQNIKLVFIQDVSQDPNQSVWKQVNHAYMDGYHFGDRLLEKVFFKFTVVKNQLKAEVAPNCVDYFESLNKSKWLKQAVKCAMDYDVFSSTADGKDNSIVLYRQGGTVQDQKCSFDIFPPVYQLNV